MSQPPLLANVIFPVFAAPYASACLTPIAWGAALAAEFVALRLLERGKSAERLLELVILANIASAIVGFAVAFVLPHGISTVTGYPRPAANWYRLLVLSFPVAYLISVVVESVTFRILRGQRPFFKPMVTIAVANAVSYAVLGGIVVYLGVFQ